jgi:hypothetical protein
MTWQKAFLIKTILVYNVIKPLKMGNMEDIFQLEIDDLKY